MAEATATASKTNKSIVQHSILLTVSKIIELQIK